MKKPRKIVVAVNSISGLEYLLKHYKGKSGDLLVICENFEVWDLAQNLSLDCVAYIPFDNDYKFRKFIHSISKNTKTWLDEKNLVSVFETKDENFASMFERRMVSFMGRIMGNFEFLERIQKKYKIAKFLIFSGSNISLKGTSAMHESLLDFSFEILAKTKKIKIVKITNSHPVYVKNFSKKFQLFYDNWSEGVQYLFYSFLKTRMVNHRAKILLVVPGAHIHFLIPLVKKLDIKGFESLTIVHNLLLKEKALLLKNRVNFVTRQDLQEIYLNKAREIKDQIKRRWQLKASKVRANFGNRNKNLHLVEALRSKMENIINFELEDIIGDYLIAKSVLLRIKPKILVTTTDPDTKILPYLRAAKSAGIKTLTIQHGAFAWPGSVNFESEKMLVWGNYYRDWFKKNLRKTSNQLEITGSVFFDKFKIIPAKNIGRKRIRVVLILLTNYYLKQFELDSDLLNLARGLRKCSKIVLVRTHPFQKVQVIDQLSRDDQYIVNVNDKPLDELISTADIVVTSDTTAGVEAIICNKPVIYWPFYGTELMPFAKYKVATLAKNWREIIDIVEDKEKNRTQNENYRKRFLKDICFRLDGLSYMRVADRIIAQL